MKLSTRTRYGTRAMLELALHYGEGLVTSREIAERQQLSLKYLEHILSSLGNAGLIRSERGPQGGYALARPPEEIDVREIYEQLEGRHGLVECTGDAETCERADGCVTRDLWCEMYEACMGVLEDTDLAELADRARDRHDSAPIMYYI